MRAWSSVADVTQRPDPPTTRHIDVIVIGSDRRADALAAARSGKRVMLVDPRAAIDDELRDAGIEIVRGDVWIVEPSGRVGVLEGGRTALVDAREVVGAASPAASAADVPAWERPEHALRIPVPISALATEERRPAPSVPAIDRARERIERDVAAGLLSPFVLSRFRRRAEELQFSLSDADDDTAVRAVADLERELRMGARR